MQYRAPEFAARLDPKLGCDQAHLTPSCTQQGNIPFAPSVWSFGWLNAGQKQE